MILYNPDRTHSGIGTTDGNNMANPAEQPFTLFGRPLTDPLAALAAEIIERTAADLEEMAVTGFDTESLFDPEWLARYVGRTQGLIRLTSRRTGVKYLVDMQVCAEGRYYATAQILGDDRLFKMTLVRADNGTIRMDIGWHVPKTAS